MMALISSETRLPDGGFAVDRGATIGMDRLAVGTRAKPVLVGGVEVGESAENLADGGRLRWYLVLSRRWVPRLLGFLCGMKLFDTS